MLDELNPASLTGGQVADGNVSSFNMNEGITGIKIPVNIPLSNKALVAVSDLRNLVGQS